MNPSLPLAAMLLAGVGSAQNTFLLPSATTELNPRPTATANGGDVDAVSFWYSTAPPQPVRVQHLWPVGDIPVAGAVLVALAFRRPNLAGYGANPAATAQLSVDLSVGPNTVAGHSVTLAANRGASPATVFNGTLNLPADPPGTGPAAFLVVLPFTAPFPYAAAAGATLVADVAVQSFVPTSAAASWPLDAVGIDAGLRTENQLPGCRFGNGALNNSIGHRNPVLGGTWFLSYQGGPTGLPAGLAGLGCLGFRGAGSTWNGVSLPIDLGPSGAPGCFFATSVAIVLPLTESSPGVYQWPLVPVPNDPALNDNSYFDQGVFLDPAANPLGVVTAWSSRWTVRSGNRPLGGKLFQYVQNGTTYPNATQGFWSDVATVARFTY